MPRQRKPQSGVARAAGRVANTTTSLGWKDIWNTNPKVYRIPTWGMRTECPAPLSEVGWVYPVSVRREGNVFYVSLPEENLKSVIEGMSDLDLSNVTVTMDTINGPLTINGSITVDWDISWQAINWTEWRFDSVNATTWNITNIVSNSITADAISTDDLNTDWLTVTNNTTIGGTLWVVGATTLGSTLAVAWNLTATTWDIATLTSTDATITNLSATAWDITSLTSDNATFEWLAVNGQSSFTGVMTTGDISATNLWVSWNTTLNNLTTTWNTSLNWATVNGNLAVSWNETVTWNVTVAWTSTFNWAVTMSDDLTVVDDLNVQGSSHLNALETTGSVDVAWTLRVDWAIDAWNWVSVTWQVESDSVVTTNTVTTNLTVNGNIALWNNATAPDFVLQDEKGAANWVAPLDANGKVDSQYLPPVYTTAIVKMGTGVFSNSDTSVVVDTDITADSFVAISNYSDIVWDLNEVINVWQLTVVSNQTETGSYKYIIVNPVS